MLVILQFYQFEKRNSYSLLKNNKEVNLFDQFISIGINALYINNLQLLKCMIKQFVSVNRSVNYMLYIFLTTTTVPFILIT
jgi:hypothetical protein